MRVVEVEAGCAQVVGGRLRFACLAGCQQDLNRLVDRPHFLGNLESIPTEPGEGRLCRDGRLLQIARVEIGPRHRVVPKDFVLAFEF